MVVFRRDAAGEERAELGAGQLDAGVDDRLQQRVRSGSALSLAAVRFRMPRTRCSSSSASRACFSSVTSVGDRNDTDQVSRRPSLTGEL